ncbi:Ig-like domain-containing protein [Acetanaerobacterium elongatum]|uniref:Ig-like domain (Group 2) n=1 Tax=Acetanaerobacterium elongatum TaxID=258515 RepID=A0A1H0G1K7_9FIRM|nr:Ig-like domain-containing protein [Acetanaerobacterium elongatum]SDO00752.1 Ig-like domain (group 2) [Acetanaerobacterium elongatum]
MRKSAFSRILALITATVVIFSQGMLLTTFAQDTAGGSGFSQARTAGESNLPDVGTSGTPGESNQPAIGDSDKPSTGESEAPPAGESGVPSVGSSDTTGLYPFKGMPKGFTLSAEQLTEKREMSLNGTLSNFDIMKQGKDYVSGEIIFLTDSEDYAKKVAEAYNGKLSSFREGVAVVTLSEGITTYQAVCAAANEKTLLPPVYPNLIYQLDPRENEQQLPLDDSKFSINAMGEKAPQLPTWADRPNDPFLQTPNDGSAAQHFQWMHEVVGTYGAWGTTKGEGVTVAVVDSGVLTTHEEFAGRILSQIDFAGGSTSLNQHGTHVAGIVAAAAGNGRGGAGIAPASTILPVRVLNTQGTGTSANILAGVNYAKSNGAAVINMSLGGYFYSKLEEDTYKAVYDAGIPIIVAAGNDGSNVKCYPAGYSSVITVAATDQAGRRANFSNWGSWISVAAPGYDIWSTGIASNSSYISLNGTSMATPVVTGVAALYLSQFPGAGARDVNKDGAVNAKDVEALRAVLKKNVTPAASSQIGTGVINAQTMFNVASPLPIFTVKASDTGDIITDTKNPVPAGSKVEISGEDFIVYTTDNTNPSVANGIVTNGKVYKDAIILPEGKTTIKALSVNGYGNVGKVVAVTYSTYKLEIPVTAVNEITGADFIYAGKSAQYTAGIQPQNATNSKVIWSITDGLQKATMLNGKLTIKANQTGSVTIRATSVSNPSKFKEKTIQISSVAVSKVTLSAATTTLVQGVTNTVALSTGVFDAKNNPMLLESVSLAYTSSNPSVATVSNTGVVTAQGSGTAKITCTALDGNGKSAAVNITVKVPVTGIENIGTTCVAAGKSVQLAVLVSPAGATNKKVVYSLDSTYKSIATVTSTGLLKAMPNASGKIVVNVKAADESKFEKNFEIQVTTAAVTSVTLDKPKLTLFSKEVASGTIPTSDKLTATATPANMVLWSSSNAKVATVDQNGNVTAVAKGTAVITALASDGSGKKATSSVTVVNPVETVTVTTTQSGIVAGKTLQLAAKCSPATAANKVEWSIVSGGDLATSLTTAGKLTVKPGASGTIVLRAKATDGSNCSADYSILVYQNTITNVSVTTENNYLTMFTSAVEGAIYSTSLKATASATSKDGTGCCDKFVWSSGNSKVVAVDPTGLLTAKGVGTAVITATAQDGSGKKGSITMKVLQPVEGLTISGSDNIPAGKSLKYTAVFTPAKASVKTVDWSIISDTGNKATIKPDGTLSVASGITTDTIKIMAKTKDGSNLTVIKSISVKQSPITTIKLDTDDSKAVFTKNGTLSKVTLFTVNLPNSQYDFYNTNIETALQLTATANYPEAPLTFTSSNTKVATVSDKGLITAVSAGNVVITCSAADGGAAKATVPVTVIIPASYIKINSKTELTTCAQPYVAKGTSRQFTAKMGATYGKPSSSAVTWDFKAGTFTNNTFTEDTAKTNELKGNGYVKISSGGLLSTSKKIIGAQYIIVTAKATDYSGAYSQIVVCICPPTSYLFSEAKGYTGAVTGKKYTIIVYTNNFADDYTVTSSNPDIVSYLGHEFSDNSNTKGYYTYFYFATPKKTGTATIKITANDGTNKSTSFTVKVS